MLRIILMFFGCCYVSVITAQSLNPANINNTIPPSPEVSSLGKYFEIPVGYFTGTPAINIPIHTIKSGSLEVPIGLSYHASGVKVEEVASWTGMGWSLSTGASLSRVVQGLPDDLGPYGFMYTPNTVKYIMSLPSESPQFIDLMYYQANSGNLDLEPDMYIFSAGGYSGKFYFDQDLHAFVLTPYQNIRINHTVDAGNKIISFKLTLPDGSQYYFGKSKDGLRNGYDISNSQDVTLDAGGTTSIPPADAIPEHITSWQVMDAVAPTGHQLSYYYVSYPAVDFGRSGETKDYTGGGCPAVTGFVTASYFKQYSHKSRLDKITSEAGEVIFISSAQNRLDVAGEGKSLDKIIIKDYNGQSVKSFEFKYTYYTSADAPALPGLVDVAEIARKRMFLESVYPYGPAIENKPRYHFTYESPGNLPSRCAASQDYWGFYNGKANGYNLIPAISSSLLYGTPGGGMLPGADRTVDFNYAKCGVIKTITYPTGGTTEYFFESNRVSPAYLQTILHGYQQSGLVNQQFNFFRSGTYQVGGNPNLYRGNFTIGNNVVGAIRVTSVFEGCEGGFNSFNCPVAAVIKGLTDPNFQLLISAPDFYPVLPPGSYQIEAVLTPNTNYPNPDFNIAVKWSDLPDPQNILVGGLRLAKVVSNDGNGQTIWKSFSYQKFDNSLLSSGELINMPVHAFNIYCGGGVGNPPVLRVVSNSAAPLSSPDGQLVRYTNVTEYFDENKSSFKNEYVFSSDHYNYVAPNGGNYPFPAHLTRDWRSGIQLEKRQYEKLSSGTYRVINKEINNSTGFDTRYENIFGIKISSLPTPLSFGYTPYSFVSEWYLPTTSLNEVTSYPNGSAATLTTLQELFYNGQYQLATQKSTNSKQQVLSVGFKYPHDFSTVSPYNEMINRNIINPVIEQISSNNTLGIQLSSEKTIYDFWQGNTLILPRLFQKSVYSHTPETELTIQAYDAKGNLLQATGKDGVTKSFVWGYNQQYPVAKLEGVSYANAIAQSSINMSIVDNPSSEVLLRAELSKLRNLNGVMASTYTFRPLVGISSETNPKGRTTFYEYDLLSRLSVIKDNESNIVKKFCYHFSGQLENCNAACPPGTNTGPIWQNEGSIFCQTINNEYTGYQQQIQRDVNPCSATYTQTQPVTIGYNTTACPLPCSNTSPTWQNVNPPYCQLANNKNTGYQLQLQEDVNTCSPTFGQYQLLSVYNTTACPLPPPPPYVCGPDNCSGNDKKCINGSCETGVWGRVASVKISKFQWRCTWAYCFSDGTISSYQEFELVSSMCPVDCFF